MMKKQSEEAKAFKSILSNYRFYQKREKALKELIERCYHLLGGYHSPGFSPSIGSAPNIEREFAIREEISRHERNLKKTQSHIVEIEEVLQQMSGELRDAAVKIYADGISSDIVGEQIYISGCGLRYQIDRELERAIALAESLSRDR